MQLEEFNALLAERFEIVEGFPSGLSQTGEPYTVLSSGSHLATAETVEGLLPIWCRSESLAIQLLWDSVMAHAIGKSGKLYLRRSAEIGEYQPPEDTSIVDPECRGTPFYAASIRLLISDRPADRVKYRNAEAYVERAADAA